MHQTFCSDSGCASFPERCFLCVRISQLDTVQSIAAGTAPLVAILIAAGSSHKSGHAFSELNCSNTVEYFPIHLSGTQECFHRNTHSSVIGKRFVLPIVSLGRFQLGGHQLMRTFCCPKLTRVPFLAGSKVVWNHMFL